MRTVLFLFTFAALTAAVAQKAIAETPENCRAIEDRTARLACFDSPSEDKIAAKISDWKTYWVIGEPALGGASICVPAVSFKLTNTSNSDLDAVEISASFTDENQKTVFGSGVVFWSAVSNNPPLPPGFSRDVQLRTSNGFIYGPGTCMPNRFPLLTVKVQARIIGESNSKTTLGSTQVDNSKSVWFNPYNK